MDTYGIRLNAGAPGAGTDEVQIITVNGGPTGGTYRLSFQGHVSAAIAFDASAATVQTALRALDSIGATGVGVAGGAGGPYTVTFAGWLAKLAIAELFVTHLNSLTGAGGPYTVTTAESVAGVTATERGAPIGALLIDTVNAVVYKNTGTVYEPTWTELSAAVVTYGNAGEMAAAGTAAANAAGVTAKTARIDHVHAIGTHDHSGATKGANLGPTAFGAGAFTADGAGRAPFAAGIWTKTEIAAAALAADATGRAIMAAGYFNAATAADKFDDSSIPSSKVNWGFGGVATTISPDDAASAGVALTVARSDHLHAITCATPGATYSFNSAAAEGGAASFLRSDAVFLARMPNNVYWTARNFADGGNINAWKINVSDQLEFGAQVAAYTMAATLTIGAQQISFSTGNVTFSGAGYISIGATPAAAGSYRLPNNTYAASARNFAGGADVDMIKVNASDLIEFGASLAAFSLGGTVTGGTQALTFSTGYVQFGAAGFALSGNIRVPNNVAVWSARNQAAGADIAGWKVNVQDDYESSADVNLGGNVLYGATTANGDLTLAATSHATVTTAYIIANQMINATVSSIAVRVKAGAVGDGEAVQTDLDGEVAVDSTNHRWYFRYGAGWHYCAITAGFQIPADETDCPVCGKPIKAGQPVVGRIDEKLSDGALHGLWIHAKCATKEAVAA